MLERADIDVDALAQQYDKKLQSYPSVQGDNVQYGQYISAKANELINKAEQYMKQYEDEFISMEHLLLAAMDIDDTTQQATQYKKEVIEEIIKKVRGEIM